MKRSSHPFQLFAACAMSSRFPVRSNQNAVYYRGGRNQWHRGFSGRPSSREDDFVTGDSHFSSVRDENLGLRHGGREDLANNTGFQPRHFSPGPVYHQNQPSYPRVPFSQNQSFNPRPHFNQNQSFNPGPRFDQNQPFNPPPRFQQNQPFRQSQPFRPRPPKSLDYRNWEYTKPGPPPHCERFIVLSYNLLADYLAINHRSKLYFHIPHHILDWEWRKRNILFELGLWSADIMCFQEVDRFHELEEELKLRGYSGIWKMRTGDPNDGCAIFWRASRFKLLHEECIEFNKLGLRDNVAQICVLVVHQIFEYVTNYLDSQHPSVRNHTENMSAQQTSSTGSNRVVMCNIHVLYNPRRGEIKLGQLRALLDRAHAISRIWNDAPVVLCGDFNCTPKSPLYNYISEQKLDVSELARDKLSGQASAEIHAPRSFFPNPWSQPSKNSPYPPRFVHEREGGIKQNNFVSDMQNQSNLNNKVENLSFWNSLQPGCSNTQMDVPNKSCIDGQPGDQNTSSDEVRTEIQQDSVNCFKDDIETTTAVRLEGSKGSPSSSHSECGFPADPINDGIREFTPPVASDATIETEHATSHPVPVEVDVSSESVANEENCDPSPVYQVNLIRNLQDLSSESVANEVKSGLDIDTGVEANMENLTLDEFDETITGDENLGENDFIPAMNSEPVEMERTPYDPSSWTPMEIETATGKADCTLLEHSLNLRSTYTEVEDFSGTRDSNGEPIATSYNRCFLGTVDYIWRSEGLETVRVLAPLPKQAMQWTPGFPTKKWGSDHIALASELAFVGKCDDQNREG